MHPSVRSLPWSLVCLAAGLLTGQAQNLVPNPGLSAGSGTKPEGWSLIDGTGAWLPAGTGEGRVLRVDGHGADAASWHTGPLPLRTGATYRLRFTGRRERGASGGTAFAGAGAVHRDFGLTEESREYGFVFTVPTGDNQPAARLGQWHANGRLVFESVEILPVLMAHARFGASHNLELGEAESIRDGVYRFEPDLGWAGANSSRVIVTNRVGFNSNRWLFHPGSELVLRHQAGAFPLREGRIRIGVNHHLGGALDVEASRDGSKWETLGRIDGKQPNGEFVVPAATLPAQQVFVRLASRGGNAGFQVDSYTFAGQLDAGGLEAEGKTHFLEVLERDPRLRVELTGIQPAETGPAIAVGLQVHNLSDRTLLLEAVGGNPTPLDGGSGGHLELAPGQGRSITLVGRTTGPGEQPITVRLSSEGRTVFAGRATRRVGFLEGSVFGHALPTAGDLELWWCEGGWKVGRQTPAPAAPGKPEPGAAVRLVLARGEYEPAQVVLRPARNTRLDGATASRLRDPEGKPSPLTVTIDEVAYVQVVRPTDGSGVPGWYPDPLPPLQPPLALRANENQPLWLTVHAPREAAAGDHRGELVLKTDRGEARIPLVVTVYDFDLPRDTHLHSALGLGMEGITRYHRLTNRADRVAVFEKYLQNFADHRISPYSFYDHAPFEVSFSGEGTNRQAQVDFTAFDRAAERWLDGARFNTFQLPLQGMGGGTFHARHLGRLAGFEEGTPEHARLFQDYLGQVERHLRERGWLRQAFTYWFDEPDPKDYEFVVAGMQRLKQAAPGIRRMLTEQPEPALQGHVEIWCGLTPEWTPERVRERREAGEEVWWYICTAPKEPYVTEFIDHPATELRLWPWQSWQYGIRGILVWASIYWTSALAYPEPTLQDPWRDPMSWTTGYGLPVGHRAPWGNGDGRFLYPPRRDPNTATEPNLDPPINSVRWENLRDGMEDYEYLWLLEQEVERLGSRRPEPPGLGDARTLLTVPSDVSRDLTHFTTDPRRILEQRDRIARAIVALRSIH